MQHYDITIIGAGPAGATLARKLQKHYKVLLVERRAMDREANKLIKNCGGLIAPDAQKALASFGLSIPKDLLVSPQMFSVKTIDFDNDITRSYQRHYINVDREKYDRWLVSLCSDVETTFSTRFRTAVREGEHYRVTLLQENKHKEITTDIIIGADGANSKVKKDLLGRQNYEPKRYISTQEWFPNTTELNQFVAIFDNEISDYYSWIIPKDDGLIFGTAIEEGQDITSLHKLQKQKLKKLGYEFTNPQKREGCYLLRTMCTKEICLGANNIALIGEAAGWISPTSAEGISYAMISGDILGSALLEDRDNFLKLYENKSQMLKNNIIKKMLKYPMVYHKPIRGMILKLGFTSIDING